MLYFLRSLVAFRRVAPVAQVQTPHVIGLPMPRSRTTTSAIAILICALASVFLGGCAPNTAEPGGSDHSATVQVLLPTSENPAAPSGDAPAAIPPTDSPTLITATDTPIAATDTPAPATYTPRPPPTYTPRPAPTREGDGEREEAVTFQAQLLDGSVLNLSDTLGTPTLLAFWAPW